MNKDRKGINNPMFGKKKIKVYFIKIKKKGLSLRLK